MVLIKSLMYNIHMIIDQIIDNKVGLGRAQYLTFAFLSLVDLNDGAQLILSFIILI